MKNKAAILLAVALTAGALAQEPATEISFETADKNGDGRVNREEASVIAGFDFSKADANLDAVLSRPEYHAALANASPSSDAERAPSSDDHPAHVSFETADKNKDGRVNRKEAGDIPGFDFSAADTNEDASLSRQEFQIALAGLPSRGS